MTPDELRKLVNRGEGQQIEFKKKADHPEKIVKEMVAFANSGGGILLLGVEDNGRISGLVYPEEEHFVMEAAIARYARPAIPYRMEMVAAGHGRKVLVYQVEDGKSKPYFWLEDKAKDRYSVYVRSADQSLKASYEMFRVLLCRSSGDAGSLEIGKTEALLFAELEKNDALTIRDFSTVAGLGKKKVSALFISLVCRQVLEIEPGEKFDLFRLGSSYRQA